MTQTIGSGRGEDKHTPRRRRELLQGALVAGAAMAASPWVKADRFPSKPIKIVVPYTPGTGSDVLARTIAQSITEKTGHAVVVENREGAGSLIGTQVVAKSAPDGYTIMIAANTLVILPSQSAKPPFDPIADFQPIMKVATIPFVLAASPSLKINTMKELMAFAKANPGKLTYGTSGPGPAQNEMELLKQVAGVDIMEVPYKSTAQAMTDLMGGQLSLFPSVVSVALPHVQSGRIKGLALMDVRRTPQLPDLPTIVEGLGIAGYTPTPVWYGFVAPAKTAPDVVASLSSMIQGAMDSAAVKTRLGTLGAQMTLADTPRFAAEIKTEYENSAALARRLGLVK